MRINIDPETGLAETPGDLFWEVRHSGSPSLCLSMMFEGEVKVVEGPWGLGDWGRMTDKRLRRATVNIMKVRAWRKREADRARARIQRRNDRWAAKEARREAKYGSVRDILDRYVGTYPPKKVS